MSSFWRFLWLEILTSVEGDMPALVRIGQQFHDSLQLSSLFFRKLSEWESNSWDGFLILWSSVCCFRNILPSELVTAVAPVVGSVVNPLPNTSNSCLLGSSSVGSTSEFLLWSVHEGSSKLSSPPSSSANCWRWFLEANRSMILG